VSDVAVGRVVTRQGSAERTGTWAQRGAATGVLSIVVATIGFVLHGNYPLGKDGPAIITWAAGVDQTRFTTGVYIELGGYLLFLVFAAWLWSVLRRPEQGTAWLSMAALVMATLAMGISAVSDGLWLALLPGVHQGTAPQTLALMREAAEQTFAISFLFGGLFTLLIGVVILQTRRLPTWSGVTAVILGVATMIPPIALPASLIWEVWVAVLSIYLLVRPVAGGGDSAAVTSAG
jgi:Domain of unknown function (DUF4386)